MIIVFSKDRAFQLEACLRTLLAQCSDAVDWPIHVLWTSSNSKHRQSYAILREAFRHVACLQFVEESSFRPDLIKILANVPKGSWREWLVGRLLKGGVGRGLNLIQVWAGLFLRPDRVVLFLWSMIRSFCGHLISVDVPGCCWQEMIV